MGDERHLILRFDDKEVKEGDSITIIGGAGGDKTGTITRIEESTGAKSATIHYETAK